MKERFGATFAEHSAMTIPWWKHVAKGCSIAVLIGCGSSAGSPTVESPPPPIRAPLPVTKAELAPLLERYVDARGRVDFAAWAAAPADVRAIREVVQTLASRLEKDAPLADWINFYNAFALHNVLKRWPAVQVEEDPFGRALLYDETMEVAGRAMSLQDVENEVLRQQYDDPRVHFALHCGARSCPVMFDRPFSASDLDRQLDDAARAFVRRDGHVVVDHDDHTIQLSAMFGWYESDLVRYAQGQSGHPAPGLLDFLILYADEGLATDLRRARDNRYVRRWQAYDWRVGMPQDEASPPEWTPSASPLDGEDPMPALDLRTLRGEPWTFEAGEGAVYLVDVWATWCRPCLAAFPRYHELQLAYERQGLRVVAIAEDEAAAPVRAFVRANHTGIEVVHDPHHVAFEAPLEVRTMPTVFLVDRKGVIRHRHEGYREPALTGLADQIEKLLAEPAP